MSRVTVLKGDPLVKEAIADAVVTPGSLIERRTTGKVRHHSVEGGDALPTFAIEDSMQGNGITDNYAEGAVVILVTPRRGDEIYARYTTGTAIAIGDYVESAGNGTLRKHIPAIESSDRYAEYQQSIVGRALQAITTTGRFAIEII